MNSKVVAATGLASSVAFMAYAVRGKSSSLLAPSFYKGVTTRLSIALTFDDGPSESTPELLDLLARHAVTATFFQIGVNVRRLPQIALQVAATGHEIGNHSETHAHLYLRSPDFIYRELAFAQRSIEDTTGVRPRFFRAPLGVRWFGLRQAQARLRLMGVMWTVIGLDWKLPAPAIVKRLARGVRNGAIFCLHDGRELNQRPDISNTLQAVRQVVPILKDQGFHFEKVSDILCPTI